MINKEKEEKYLQMLEVAVDYLECEKIERCMRTLAWGWGTSKESPCVGEIRTTARRLGRDLLKCVKRLGDDATTIKSGGFRIETDVELSFVDVSFEITGFEIREEELKEYAPV